MKIGFFCYSLRGAGPRVRAKNLITGLAERTSHEPVLVTQTDSPFHHEGVETHRVLTTRNLVDPSTVLEIRRHMSDCDVIHVPVNFYQLLYVAALGLGPRVAGAGIQHEPHYRVLTRLVGVERMIETHEYVAQDWEDAGVDASYIYPAVDTDEFEPAGDSADQEFRDRLGVPPDNDMILFVGELKPWKGAGLMSELARELRDDPISVVIIGDGEQRHLFEDRADLIFEGFVDNDGLPDYYSAADVTVVPSKNESFSIVSLESIACGTPVVTTTSPSCIMSRLFRSRGTYLWTDREVGAVAQEIRTLLGDEERYERQVALGFETIDEMGLSISDAIRQYVSIYEEVAHDN